MKTVKKKVQLDRIVGVLECAKEAYRSLADVMPLVRDRNNFNAQMCRMMLEIKQPMLVQKGNDYQLVSGHREWQLALHTLDKSEKITCQIVTEASTEFLNQLAWHDAYGSTLLYGISPKGIGLQFDKMITAVKPEIKKAYFPKFASVHQFSKATNLSRASFYLDGRVKNKSKSSEKVTFETWVQELDKE